MKLTECHAGINITSEKFQLVEFEKNSGLIKLVNIIEVPFERKIDFEKFRELEILTELQKAFDKIQSSLNLKSNTVSFSIPAKLFLFHQTPYDNSLLKNDLLDEFRWQLSVLYPFTISSNLAIQFIEILKNPVIDTNTALIIALSRKYIQLIKTFCLNNRFQVRFIDSAHLAAARTLKHFNTDSQDGISALIQIDSESVSVIFLFEGKIVYSKTGLVSGQVDVLNFIDKEFRSTKFKRINRNVLSLVLLTGENNLKDIVPPLQKIVNQVPAVFNPFANLQVENSIIENLFLKDLNNTFASAAGAAFKF